MKNTKAIYKTATLLGLSEQEITTSLSTISSDQETPIFELGGPNYNGCRYGTVSRNDF